MRSRTKANAARSTYCRRDGLPRHRRSRRLWLASHSALLVGLPGRWQQARGGMAPARVGAEAVTHCCRISPARCDQAHAYYRFACGCVCYYTCSHSFSSQSLCVRWGVDQQRLKLLRPLIWQTQMKHLQGMRVSLRNNVCSSIAPGLWSQDAAASPKGPNWSLNMHDIAAFAFADKHSQPLMRTPRCKQTARAAGRIALDLHSALSGRAARAFGTCGCSKL